MSKKDHEQDDNGFYPFETENGTVKWNTYISRREKSGIPGLRQVVIHRTFPMLAIVQKFFPAVTSIKRLRLLDRAEQNIVYKDNELGKQIRQAIATETNRLIEEEREKTTEKAAADTTKPSLTAAREQLLTALDSKPLSKDYIRQKLLKAGYNDNDIMKICNDDVIKHKNYNKIAQIF